MFLPQAKRPLNVIVVGAGKKPTNLSRHWVSSVNLFDTTLALGIGGLATAISLAIRGHNVLVLEATPKLQEVGAGIQIAPNMRRVFKRLGIDQRIKDKAIVLERIKVFRWQNGRLLNEVMVDHQYGECAVIHRADLHTILVERALGLHNIVLRLNSTVMEICFDSTKVILCGGESISGDVIIAADGIKSPVRSKMFLDGNQPVPTGDAAFRIVIPRSIMIQDPELRELIDTRQAVRWVGPDRHIVGYPIRNHELYNVVLAHPDKGWTSESWTASGSKDEMLEVFRGWEPRVQKIVRAASNKEVLKSKLCLHLPLQTWVRGSCTLVGDACHPMLPYVAQGAAQALEDAAALGVVLSNVETVSEVPLALRIYEKSRKHRAEEVQRSGTQNRVSLHLHDGPDQVARDEKFRASLAGGEDPDKWTDRKTQQILWGWDAEAEAQRCWSGMTVSLIEPALSCAPANSPQKP
ncbi:hypothetical protein AJ80_04848 [Polytolypa hystricis UAMH7299]|uniref:FAD-binding domain-containing protein n=1 Tax=Polytolypa hystricis (strain UAMH7299) TaxID=1447883 RepID=A0A2B7Y952_POLH7|nr:hypothetical protein AJ80_04848 [Polytolypa hystricis UAMH7299]